MASVKRFSPSAYAGDVLEAIKGDGAVIIEGAASIQTVDKALSELGTISGSRVYGLAGKSSTFTTEMLMNPLYIELTKRLLTDTCVIYYEKERTVSTAEPQVSMTTALAAQPSLPGWGLRRQDECHHTKHPAKRETDFGIAYAATDIRKENGAIRVVLGSNRWNDIRDPTDDDETLVELRKGDALLCLGSVYYGVASNNSSAPSVLLSAFSTPGWCRQEENQYLAIPLEVLETFPERIQRFLGWYVSRPYGGAVEHMEPLDFLKAKGDWSNAFVLISGRLGAIYGHQNMLFLGGGIIVIFSLGNAFCKTYESFVAMRAMTGIGGGIIMPNAVAVLTIMIPPGQSRNVTLAAFAASPPCGALVGALLVGVFLEYTEWKWFFIVIAILGTVMFGSLFLVLPHDEPVDKGGSIDYLGIVFGLGGLLLFNFAWNQSPSIGWDSPSVISTLIVSLLLFTAFMVWESKFAKDPIMPLTVFAAPTFTALIFVALLTYMSVGISLWYMVAWQQLLRNWTVLHVAIGWIPYAVGASMSVGLAAWLIPRIEAQSIMAIGILASIVSCLLLATMPEQQVYWAQTFPSIFIGSLCPDFVYVAAQIIASNSVGKREQGVAGSLIGTLNLYGNSLGLGFAGTIESQLIKNGASHVTSFRAALYFAMALSAAALVLDFGFVRMSKDDRKGWEQENSRRGEELQEP
ncbi:putative MFS-type transporter [Colletotrichum tropicale]|nr:putative MFS-type transporter [Colletotrichum tropicale]